MGGVERVVADHGQALLGEVVPDDVVEVFVVSPGQVDIVEPAVGLVDAAWGLVFGDLRVGVLVEELGEDDLVGEAAADGEGVADDGPLRLAEEAEDLAEVVDEPGEDRTSAGGRRGGSPRRSASGARSARVGVGVAVVDEGVEELHRLPDAHVRRVRGEVLRASSRTKSSVWFVWLRR